MFGLTRNEEKLENDEDDRRRLPPPNFHDQGDLALDVTKTRWGDYETGTNNQGVNGGLGLRSTSNSKNAILIELGAGLVHSFLTLPFGIDPNFLLALCTKPNGSCEAPLNSSTTRLHRSLLPLTR